MDKVELERRTKEFALRIVLFVASLPKNKVADVLGYQLLKSGTSVGANYREANRAESHDDFIHKIGIVEKEASESEYWLELLQEAHLGEPKETVRLLRECRELIAIFTAIGKTAKARRTPRARPVRNSQSDIRNPKL
jgi:four helix bundle protein